jgi:hypothetical protein
MTGWLLLAMVDIGCLGVTHVARGGGHVRCQSTCTIFGSLLNSGSNCNRKGGLG